MRDYGDLVAMTAVTDPVLGDTGTRDLSFSAPAGGGGGGVMPALAVPGDPGAPGGPGAPGPPGAAQEILGVNDTSPGVGDSGGGPGSGGAAGSGSGGGGAGGGESLPFTGFLPGIVAATGSALAASGVALRRALRGRDGG